MPTYDWVRLMFDYNPETGDFTRRIPRSGKRGGVGEPAGSVISVSRYIMVSVGRRSMAAHRLIWLWYYGYLPENSIDHIDQDTRNNRIENLREVSHRCNCRNRKTRQDNTSGVTGISWCKRNEAWHVSISGNAGEDRFIGYFASITEAACHRYAAEQCLDWHACDLNSSAAKFLKQQGVLK